MTHTPGPWRLDTRVGCLAVYPKGEEHNCLSGASDWAIHYASGYKTTDEAGNFTQWNIDPQKVANATLMAAAPDLLEACKLALGFTAQDDLNEDDDEIADVQAALIQAIERATGEAES